MGWTQAICDDCWDNQNPERPSPRAGAGEAEQCFFCDKPTESGIYVRADPESKPARGVAA